MGLRMNLSLARCGKCGRRYSNPLTHTCVNPRRRGRTRVKPRVTFGDCPKCHRPVANPLTHVCKTRTDFRKRLRDKKQREKKERQKRRRRSRPPAPQHDYHNCSDPACQRRTCQAYREGFADGIENCPGPHAGD